MPTTDAKDEPQPGQAICRRKYYVSRVGGGTDTGTLYAPGCHLAGTKNPTVTSGIEGSSELLQGLSVTFFHSQRHGKRAVHRKLGFGAPDREPAILPWYSVRSGDRNEAHGTTQSARSHLDGSGELRRGRGDHERRPPGDGPVELSSPSPSRLGTKVRVQPWRARQRGPLLPDRRRVGPGQRSLRLPELRRLCSCPGLPCRGACRNRRRSPSRAGHGLTTDLGEAARGSPGRSRA